MQEEKCKAKRAKREDAKRRQLQRWSSSEWSVMEANPDYLWHKDMQEAAVSHKTNTHPLWTLGLYKC